MHEFIIVISVTIQRYTHYLIAMTTDVIICNDYDYEGLEDPEIDNDIYIPVSFSFTSTQLLQTCHQLRVLIHILIGKSCQ